MKKEDDNVSKDNDYTKIKSYKDACACLGVKERDFAGIEKDEVAYIKLKTIAKAINEGWEPDFTDGSQYKYWPWFWLSPQEKSNSMSDTERRRVVLFGGSVPKGTDSGFLYAGTSFTCENASADIGYHLCFKKKEISEYAGRQFLEIWRDYLLN